MSVNRPIRSSDCTWQRLAVRPAHNCWPDSQLVLGNGAAVVLGVTGALTADGSVADRKLAGRS
jgi:hypothetical protein